MQPDTCLDVMRSVHRSVLASNPEIAIAAVRVHDKPSERQTLVSLIPDTLWSNCLELQVEWMRRFGVLDKFKSSLSHPELALKVVEVCPNEFHKVHKGLRGSLDFMKRAVNISGRTIRYASRTIQNDRTLQVIAVANHAWSISNEQRQELAQYVNTKLGLRDRFHLILCGIHFESNLRILNIGSETSIELKRSLALNLGVPLGGDWKLLQKCKHNIDHPPPLAAGDEPSEQFLRRRHRLFQGGVQRLQHHQVPIFPRAVDGNHPLVAELGQGFAEEDLWPPRAAAPDPLRQVPRAADIPAVAEFVEEGVDEEDFLDML